MRSDGPGQGELCLLSSLEANNMRIEGPRDEKYILWIFFYAV